ncbi:MAG: Rpp14/Pop5 family protein [Candidatus Thorarchaeota archaeon]
MNERIRYINIRFISPIQLQEKDAWFTISSEVKHLFGIHGAAEVGLFLSYFDQETQGGIFRTSHNFVYRVRAAICFIHWRYNTPILIYSENVSGSLKKAKKLLKTEKFIGRYHALRKLLCETWEQPLDDDNIPN